MQRCNREWEPARGGAYFSFLSDGLTRINTNHQPQQVVLKKEFTILIKAKVKSPEIL